jgi:hypothetical protein
MKVLAVYARLYWACLMGAGKAAWRSPWTLLLPGAALGALVGAGLLLSTLGILGGFLMAMVQAALLSAYFYFVQEAVFGSRVEVKEVGKSLRVYFWSFVNLAFVLWIATLVLGMFVRGRNAPLLFQLLELAAFILLNAAPEVITQRGTYGGIATIQASVQFIQENWLEWFIPNALIGALLYYGLPWSLSQVVFALSGDVGRALPALASLLGFSALFHFAALFRGFLFREFSGSSHRQRMFKFRNL